MLRLGSSLVGLVLVLTLTCTEHNADAQSCYGGRRVRATSNRSNGGNVIVNIEQLTPFTVGYGSSGSALYGPGADAQLKQLQLEVELLKTQAAVQQFRQLLLEQANQPPPFNNAGTTATKTMPLAAPVGGSLAQQYCFRCHSEQEAQTKGKGLVLFKGTAPIQLTAKEDKDALAVALGSGHMPKGTKIDDPTRMGIYCEFTR